MDFLLHKKSPEDKQLVGFHLSLPMGYVDITPYFCMSTETIAYITNAAMDGRHTSPPHPNQRDADMQAQADCAPDLADNEQWEHTPPPL